MTGLDIFIIIMIAISSIFCYFCSFFLDNGFGKAIVITIATGCVVLDVMFGLSINNPHKYTKPTMVNLSRKEAHIDTVISMCGDKRDTIYVLKWNDEEK